LHQSVQLAMVTRPTELCLIPGAKAFIEKLIAAKIDIAIATNKGQHSLQRALQATELDKLFKVTRSAGQTPAKPCPQMLEEIMGLQMEQMLINATQTEEVRVALIKDNHLFDLDIECPGEVKKKGSIYSAVVTRREPSLDAVFVEYGSKRQGFFTT